MLELNKVYQGHALELLKQLPDNCIDCVVTSIPYYGLRKYGDSKDEIGQEPTPEEYVQKIVTVFAEVKRVLKSTGTVWLNIGDSYWGGKGKSGAGSPESQADRIKNGKSITKASSQIGGKGFTRPTDKKHPTIKPKDLIGVPWMIAFALRDIGYYLRDDIIWHKPNAFPSSVTDRCTKAHEYIFLLSKSKKYYFDADSIKTIAKEATIAKAETMSRNPREQVDNKGGNQSSLFGIPAVSGNKKLRPNGIVRDRLLDYDSKEKTLRQNTKRGQYESESDLPEPDFMVNKRSVWTVPTSGFNDEHFAVFPPELIVDCIKAGCPEDGIVLDPFGGANTTGIVSRKLNRNFIVFELYEKNVKIGSKRLSQELGMFI